MLILEQDFSSNLNDINSIEVLLRVFGRCVSSKNEKLLDQNIWLFEKKFFELSSQIQKFSQISAFVSFFSQKSKNDEVWDFLSDTLSNTILLFNDNEYVEVINGYAQVRRGSDNLWSVFLEKSQNSKNVNSKIQFLRASIYAGFDLNNKTLNETMQAIVDQISQLDPKDDDTQQAFIFICKYKIENFENFENSKEKIIEFVNNKESDKYHPGFIEQLKSTFNLT